MGGRGRGRGAGMSLNTEFLGLNRGDLPPGAVSPPQLFPILINKPTHIKKGGKEIKLLQYHSNLARQFRVHQDTVLANLDYSLLPAELRPGVKKRMKGARPRVEAKRTRPNLEERLHNLEDKEKNENEDEDEDEEKKKDDDEDEKKDEDEDEVEEEDEEMDGGTDYANNYFEDGDEVDEEDDNLDEGGIY
ncbi:DNA-directed RNA polymerase III subunit RPC7 [Eurytemora carolleeae]|uniref:DNA-directed RNA polymerase III subunit RPC7 n=1 Tax=Eurytemora carolleeae TaxID=1294199 RepID=UPI000C772377|nr:DNA-directed RNA polymerase III subunit RPC7 [Eurytemora carolleeae]|eukprot:XP_023332634.1 DNA-directed RNA polymerase III subunit RPC7-like [Eurytemora affinis]